MKSGSSTSSSAAVSVGAGDPVGSADCVPAGVVDASLGEASGVDPDWPVQPVRARPKARVSVVTVLRDTMSDRLPADPAGAEPAGSDRDRAMGGT